MWPLCRTGSIFLDEVPGENMIRRYYMYHIDYSTESVVPSVRPGSGEEKTKKGAILLRGKMKL